MSGWAGIILALCLFALSCGDDPATGSPDDPLTESRVIQLFLEWACPAAPGLAQTLYRPFALELPDQQTWLLRTAEGNFHFSESTRTFETDPEASEIVEGLRAKSECRAGQ
jgi:hypothetical protein